MSNLEPYDKSSLFASEDDQNKPRTIAYHDTIMGLLSLGSGTLISALSILYGVEHVDRYNSPKFILVIIGILTGWCAIITVNSGKRAHKVTRDYSRKQSPAHLPPKRSKLKMIGAVVTLIAVAACLYIRFINEQAKPKLSLAVHSGAECHNKSIRRLFVKHLQNPSKSITDASLLAYVFYSKSKLCLNQSCEVESGPLRLTYEHRDDPETIVRKLCKEGKKLKRPIDPKLCELTSEDLEDAQLSLSFDYQQCAQPVCKSFLRYREDPEAWCHSHKDHLCCPG